MATGESFSGKTFQIEKVNECLMSLGPMEVKLGDVGAGRLANIAHFAPISRIFFLSLRTP